jgi:hypothetical protein
MNKASMARAPHVRGQARVTWLVPLAAIALGVSLWNLLPSRRAPREVYAAVSETASPALAARRYPTQEAPAPTEEAQPNAATGSVSVEKDTYEAEMAEIAHRAMFFQRAFEDQQRDQAWAGELEAAVRNAYPTTEGVDAILESIECRSTMCRFQFRYAGKAERNAHLGALAHQFPELSTAIYAYPGEPTIHDRAVAYFARTGTELPSPPPSH